jgi:N-acetylmuramoyl-L-alanine amidase
MHLAFVLAQLGPFEVKLSRKDAAGKKYQARIAEAEAWGADAIVSVHSDVRGEAWAWGSTDTETCWRNDQAPGYAVLWSEDGEAETVARREKLGRAMARQLNAAGFRAYSGEDYGSLYKPDAEQLGWVDLRPRKKSVYFLRASRIPTVIVETHHALDPAEVTRWEKLETVDAFALAVGNAVVEAMRP